MPPIFLKNFAKMIDILIIVCYTIYIRREKEVETPMVKKKKGLKPKEKAALMKATAALITSVAALLTAISLFR